MAFEEASEAVEAGAAVGIVVVFVAVLLLLSNSADNFRTMLFVVVGVADTVLVFGDRPTVEDIFEAGEVVRSEIGKNIYVYKIVKRSIYYDFFFNNKIIFVSDEQAQEVSALLTPDKDLPPVPIDALRYVTIESRKNVLVQAIMTFKE